MDISPTPETGVRAARRRRSARFTRSTAPSSPPRGRRLVAFLGAPALIAAGVIGLQSGNAAATDQVEVFTSQFTATNGEIFTATNYLVQDSPDITAAKRELVRSALAGENPDAKKIVTKEGRIRHEYLIVWAGDFNAADNNTANLSKTQPVVGPVKAVEDVRDNAPGPDFLAVIDATPASPTYGKVVNTVTTGPVIENEPHHMQYIWNKGDSIYAGGLYSDITYVFDVKALPRIELKGVNLPTDTPCGSIPDAYWTLKDGTAYATYMGGADVPGPCLYTNGETRVSNGFGGSPGSIVRIGPNGETLSEIPAASAESEDPNTCVNIPVLPVATCANPHGIQVREDLNILISSDYAEPRNIVLDPVKAPDPRVFRPTVRTFDITERDNAKLKSVSYMPDGPRTERNPAHEEPRGIMEVTVTNRKQNKGAFASSMCGGVVYYTADITSPKPVWREVFDVTTAARDINPQVGEGGGCSGAGWVQTSPDDKYLYHAVIGRGPGSINTFDTGSAKQVYMLDIQKLLKSKTKPKCSIDTVREVSFGGAEKDCPTLVDTFAVQDNTSGGPHWGAFDNFKIGKDGFYRELTKDVQRIAFSNYFVARTNTDGNHKLCILNISEKGQLTMDANFVDENSGSSCVSFNRTSWPHGDYGDAKPHSMVFAVADEDVR